MGLWFSRNKSRVTQHDRAVLRLKSQRDELKRYTKRLETNMERERQLAKELVAKKQMDRAKLLLKKKRVQEELLLKTESMLDNIETMTDSLEFAQLEVQVMDGLKEGNSALKQIHALMSLSDVENILMETAEGIEKQKEIDSLLSGRLNCEDEQAVEEELEQLLTADSQLLTDTQLPSVPDTQLPSSEPEHASASSSQRREQPVMLPA